LIVCDLFGKAHAETDEQEFFRALVENAALRLSISTASIICASVSAVDAYLSFGLAEAKALITEHRAAVWAIAEALMVHRTLDAEQIDTIIAAAPERARRIDWNGVLENAACFTAGLEN
jgi:hypothetical protein